MGTVLHGLPAQKTSPGELLGADCVPKVPASLFHLLKADIHKGHPILGARGAPPAETGRTPLRTRTPQGERHGGPTAPLPEGKERKSTPGALPRPEARRGTGDGPAGHTQSRPRAAGDGAGCPPARRPGTAGPAP